jgi:hypothetical protein
VEAELSIVRAFLNYETWEKHHADIGVGDMPDDLQPMYRCLDVWHKTQNEDGSSLHVLDFASLFFAQNKTNKEFFSKVFDTLESYEPNPATLNALLVSVKRNRILEKLSLTAYDVTQGKKPYEEVERLHQKLAALSESDAVQTTVDEFVTNDLDELLHHTYQTPGLRWRLPSLNRSLGSLRKGTLGVIQARVETGKTTFCASEFSYMAENLAPGQGPVLWFNNEQEGEAVMLYVYRAALGITLPELLSNKQRWKQEYMKKVGDRLRVYDNAKIDKATIEKLCQKYKPSLIVVDQLDKIKGFKADREDLMLGEVYQWAREMAKQWAPFVGVCQAGATGHNKKWLDMNDMNNSKTAKAAECDFILGIGKSLDTGWEEFRFFHLSKNKCLGDSDTDPALRHAKWETKIDVQTARYKDIA